MTLAEQISDVLGGEKVLRTKIHDLVDFNALIRKGIPFGATTSLMKVFDLTQDELIKPLGISRATFSRKKKAPSSRLESISSDRLYRIAYVIARTKSVFGNDEKAARWLHKPNRAMQGEVPFSNLDTEVGYSIVLDILERIEYGDYS